MRRWLGLLVLLSGAASLTYQVTWVRLIGLSIGASSASVSAVVAAFFGGLSLGALLAPRLLRRWSALRVYLALELAIGVFGVLELPLLARLDDLLVLVPQLAAALPFKFLVAAALLVVPTTCMGATFPVVNEILVRAKVPVATALAELYALNTIGAVVGALVSGFVLIPALGLRATSLVAVALNFVIVGIGLLLERRAGNPGLQAQAHPQAALSASAKATLGVRLADLDWRVLWVLVLTGFVSIAAEICWTKLLTLFVGTTLYGFSTVLAVYLLGVAVGSAAVRRVGARTVAPAFAFALGLTLLGLTLLLSRNGLNWIADVQRWIDQRQLAVPWAELVRFGLVFAVLFPPTCLLGVLFPISVHNVARRGARAGAADASVTGLAYGVNTLAGIVAAVFTGLVWIPLAGTSAVLTTSALLVAFTPVLFIRELLPSRPRVTAVSALVLASLALGVLLPGVRLERLVNSIRQDRFQTGPKRPQLLFMQEGRTGLISASTSDHVTANLYDNGLRESVVHLQVPEYGLFIESMLGLYPYFLHREPKSAFVVGLGGGATMRALQFTQLRSLHVVELEPVVRDALVSLVGAERAGLTDPRLSFEINDARNALLLGSGRYDLIVSQPSHPWRAGASAVFTREFFELAASHLESGGIYAHWVNLFRMDEPTLDAIVRSFLAVFPYGLSFVHQGTADMLLVGSREPLLFEQERVEARMGEPRVKLFLERWNIRRPSDMLALFGLSRDELQKMVGSGTLSTDDNLLPEVRLARRQLENESGEGPVRHLKQFSRFDIVPYLDPDSAATWLGELGQSLQSSGAGLASRKRVLGVLRKLDPAAYERLNQPAGGS